MICAHCFAAEGEPRHQDADKGQLEPVMMLSLFESARRFYWCLEVAWWRSEGSMSKCPRVP